MEKDIIEIKKSDLQGLFKILTNYPQISKEQVINEMTKAFGEEALKPQNIKERIKTFEDAVNAIGEDHPLVAQYKAVSSAFKEADNNLHLFAYTRLAIIAEALNEGWRPEYTEDEYRYYPWFGLYTKEEYDKMDEDDKKRCRFVGRSHNMRVRMAVSSLRVRLSVLRTRIRISALGLPSSLVTWQSIAVSNS